MNNALKKEVVEEAKTKLITVEHCLCCPKWGECKPSKKLSSKDRLWLTCGVGVPNFTLIDCPLKNAVNDDGWVSVDIPPTEAGKYLVGRYILGNEFIVKSAFYVLDSWRCPFVPQYWNNIAPPKETK